MPEVDPRGPETIVRSSGSHNCGGRCVLRLHVRNGKIERISGDDAPDTPGSPQLRACLRCRAYRDRLYHPDRLLVPLRRVGRRGTGQFTEASWSDALKDIAACTARIQADHGPDSLYLNYATGNAGLVAERVWMARLLGLTGGYLSYYGSYSAACAEAATPLVYGTNDTGSSRETWADAKLILLVGFNPAETIHGTNTMYYLKRAKQAGVRIIGVDPIYTSTVGALADQWVPIRPTTDNALFDAMAWVMVTQGWHDQAFLDRYCLGFDDSHLPEGVPAGQSYRSYLEGELDGTPKTPQWAESITGIPQRVIAELAREFAQSKPAALVQGLGPQRHAVGEQFHRGGAALAAMTGNVGIRGGWAAGSGYQARRPFVAAIPRTNPNPKSISVFTWPDAIVHGAGMGEAEGVRGAPRLESNIKMIFNLGGNCLVNQHADARATAELLTDETRVERIVVSEHFLTPSARFADWILPSDAMFERDDIVTPWDWGDYVLSMNKAVEPPGSCRNGYSWISELAGRLGLGPAFTEGRSLDQWLRFLVERTAAKNPGFPSYEEFRAQGGYRWTYTEPDVAFQDQITDPEHHPFPTASGKIELFSQRLYSQVPRTLPPIPCYVPAWEGPDDALKVRFPLQCLGHHTKRRVHSTFDNVPSMEETEPHALWISPTDAEPRGLKAGDKVRVFNDRGAVEVAVKVTVRMRPGVVSLPQGAWWTPDASGVDLRGSINTLTKYQPTPLAKGNPTHTNLVEVAAIGSPR